MRVMLIGLCGTLVVAAGCQQGLYATDHTISKTTVGEAVTGRAALQRPIGLPGHEVVLVPFVVEDEKGWFEADDPYQRRGSPAMRSKIGYADSWLENASRDARSGASYAAQGVRWHNAIGRDLSTGEHWMLLDRRGVISSVAFISTSVPQESRVTSLLFLATTEDTNGDGLLDSLDARRAWMADGDARNPRVVTPEGMYLTSAWIDWQRRYVYFQLLGDTDGDGRFTDADESAPWLLKMGDGGMAEPLIDDATLRRARELLDK